MNERPRRTERLRDRSSVAPDSREQVTESGLTDLQVVELGILREFVRVCEMHGLRYYLAYGSLLGAVRHGGFIPWDDDIDVTMPRVDYERFAMICSASLGPGFKWQSYATEPHYPHWFGKLIRTDTVFRHARTQGLTFQQSVYIDVFPLDGLAEGRWEALAQHLLLRACRFRLGVGVRRTPAKRLAVQVFRVLSRRAAIALIEAMGRRFPANRAKRWICVGGPYRLHRQSFESRWFGPGAAQRFHDLVVMGPSEWDEYLTQLYGDYMTPPPPDQRMADHEVTELQLTSGDISPRS